ncbi:MAG: hypothetical protein WEB58_13000 [Planctomycetaceae bacterium]
MEILANIRKERAKLTKGMYRAKGRSVQSEPYLKEGDVIVFGAFDESNQQVRFEYEEPIRLTTTINGQKETKSAQHGYRLLKTPNKTFVTEWYENKPPMFDFIEKPADYEPSNIGKPIDVRSFGIANWGTVHTRMTCEEMLDDLAKAKVIEIKIDNGKCVITYEFVDARVSYWIECERGFTVTRFNCDVFDKKTKKWIESMSRADVTWEEKNDVWVPISLILEAKFNGKEVYNIDLEWEYVNLDPPPKVFDLRAMMEGE